MKKILLAVLALFVATGSMNAESTLKYGFTVPADQMSSVGTGAGGSNYCAAIEVPELTAKAMQGSKLTSVSLGFGSGLNKNIVVYLSYDPKGEPFYTQEFKVPKPNSVSDVELTTPYTIEGKKFYIGYTYRQSSTSGRPITFTGNAMNNEQFNIMGLWPDNGKDQAQWESYSQFGALVLQATITGDNLPSSLLVPTSLGLPLSCGVDKSFTYSLDVVNMANTTVNSLEVTAKIGDAAPITRQVTLSKPLAAGETTTVELEGVSANENLETPVLVSVTKVNGGDNTWSEAVKGMLIVSDYTYPRRVVLEEGTGIGCGYCPAGWVAMETMREKYPEEYIGIAIHNYSGDPMRCRQYNDFITKMNPSGYPFAAMNRTPINGMNTFSPQPAAVEAHFKDQRGMLNMNLYLKAEFTDDTHKNIAVTVYNAFGHGFCGDNPSVDYGYALVQTEDNVGPYLQTNNYSGGGMGDMGGFEDKPSPVSLMYNDVARSIVGWNGSLGNLPSALEPLKTYKFTETMPIADGQNVDNTNVIVLLIDKKDGHIVTAAKNYITGTSNWDPTGVEEITDTEAAVTVFGGNGQINILGSYDAAEVYSLSGMRVATSFGSNAISVAPGIYAVRVINNGKTTVAKVAVK